MSTAFKEKGVKLRCVYIKKEQMVRNAFKNSLLDTVDLSIFDANINPIVATSRAVLFDLECKEFDAHTFSCWALRNIGSKLRYLVP